MGDLPRCRPKSKDQEAAQAASRGLKAGERVDPYTVRRDLDSLVDYF